MSEVNEIVGSVGGRGERTLASLRRAWEAFDAGAPRDGRVKLQCRRCFLARYPDPVTSADLRQWAYAGQPRQQWMHWNLTRALRSLGAVQVGRSPHGARPAIWSLDTQRS
jgi:hypothetical protein